MDRRLDLDPSSSTEGCNPFYAEFTSVLADRGSAESVSTGTAELECRKSVFV
ncbi:MAG: hypothetical protein ACXVBC_13275 [Bdellovibrionota bacterium]